MIFVILIKNWKENQKIKRVIREFNMPKKYITKEDISAYIQMETTGVVK